MADKLANRWRSKRCAECRYGDVYYKCCDYLGKTGTPRITVCKPGNDCTVFEPKAGEAQHESNFVNAKSFTKPRKRIGFDREQALAMYRDGMHDRQIAEALGVSKSVIFSWRSGAELPPQCALKFDEERVRALYFEGKNDNEIARALGIDRHMVSRWRGRNGLKDNYDRRKKRGPRA